MKLLLLALFYTVSHAGEKFCINCKYFVSYNTIGMLQRDKAQCQMYPINKSIFLDTAIEGSSENKYNIFDKPRGKLYHSCIDVRRYNDFCGSSGKNYVDKIELLIHLGPSFM